MRNPEATREAILEKSGVLFNTQGYKATSISNITEATGFTKGAIYRHFTNKADLEKETLSFLTSKIFEKMSAVIKKEETAGAKLKAICRFFESYVTNPPLEGGCPLLNSAIEVDDSYPELKKQALYILKTLEDSIIKILLNGVKFGQLKKDIDKQFYSTMIIASLEGAIMMSKLKNNDDDIRRVVSHLYSLIERIEN